MGRGNFVRYRDTSAVICAKMAEPIEMPLCAGIGSRNRVRSGSRSPEGRGNFG